MLRARKLAFVLAGVLALGMVPIAFAQGTTNGTPAAEGSARPEANAAQGPNSTAGTEASITVNNQPIVNNTVTIQQVVVAVDGWVDIHADVNGYPGANIGHAPVKAGLNTNVQVNIDASQATPTLFATLYIDAGQKGVWEFPGMDEPYQTPDGLMVEVPFQVSGLPSTGANVAAGTPSATDMPALAAAAQVTGTATLTITATITATAVVDVTAAAVTSTTAAATTELAVPAADITTATTTVRPSALPASGGTPGNSSVVVVLVGLGAFAFLAGLGLNLVRRSR